MGENLYLTGRPTLKEFLRYVRRHAVNSPSEAALAEFTRFQPDVALLDIGMPKLDGNAVAGAIRKLPAGKTTTLVAITGWGQAKDKSDAIAAGFDHHMTKPVDPERVNLLLNA